MVHGSKDFSIVSKPYSFLNCNTKWIPCIVQLNQFRLCSTHSTTSGMPHNRIASRVELDVCVCMQDAGPDDIVYHQVYITLYDTLKVLVRPVSLSYSNVSVSDHCDALVRVLVRLDVSKNYHTHADVPSVTVLSALIF